MRNRTLNHAVAAGDTCCDTDTCCKAAVPTVGITGKAATRIDGTIGAFGIAGKAAAVFTLAFGLLAGAPAVQGQDPDAGTIEEIVVVGSQIRGASISDALPVTVMTQEDIEAFGVQSGDELLEYMAEQGQNFFSESENISGGVNSARGDIGAFNLRNLGTGNTLVLLNGRRMVNAASYQTESVGGSFVPVNTVNAQSLPVTGLRRAEVLKDGASAIYGADAVAGVVNYVLRNDFEGFRVRARFDDYDNIPRQDKRVTAEWGGTRNDGRTNIGIFASYFDRDRVNSLDDPRWSNSDFRYRTPEPWSNSTVFRNTSSSSTFGQFDIIRNNSVVDALEAVVLENSDSHGDECEDDDGMDVPCVPGTHHVFGPVDNLGEFETFPTGHANCEYQITEEVCGAADSNGTYRTNLNGYGLGRDLYSDLERLNVYAYVEHDFDGSEFGGVLDGVEGFGEFTYYWSDSNTIRHSSTKLGAVAAHEMAADNPYNPFGAVGSPGRLQDLFDEWMVTIPDGGLRLQMDTYRWNQSPRIVDVDGEVFRFVAGLRGVWSDWDWEGAITYSKADRHDVTGGRISNTLLQEGLNDTSMDAINPFGQTFESSNIGRAVVDVTRDNEQELTMVDYKMSNPAVYELPYGPLGALIGFEYRDESFVDDRDPRLDGTIRYVDNSSAGRTFPFVSDIMNSSPNSDGKGDRQVTSLFGELQIPIFSTLDAQVAVRYEDFSDVGNTTVGKLALGWRPIEQILVRASWSEAFRAPNLITINEETVSRSNTRNDALCFYVDPEEDELDCRYSIQRTVQGTTTLQPEKSDNYSYGVVLTPFNDADFTLTIDSWGIEKEDTIGLFGEENHSIYDLLLRIRAGTSDCDGLVGNPAVVYNDIEADDTERAGMYIAADVCPEGEIQQVDDQYANLDTRILKGIDIGVYWSLDLWGGGLDIRYVGTWLREFEQKATGLAAQLEAESAAGTLPEVNLAGFGDLRGVDGNPERKHTLRMSYNYGDWRGVVSGLYYDAFVQMLTAGPSSQREFPISSMKTWNAFVDREFDYRDMPMRLRFGMNNVFDERAPLADDSFGYFADQHRDLGRYMYLDLQVRVN